jgi:hypothetical protein
MKWKNDCISDDDLGRKRRSFCEYLSQDEREGRSGGRNIAFLGVNLRVGVVRIVVRYDVGKGRGSENGVGTGTFPGRWGGACSRSQ